MEAEKEIIGMYFKDDDGYYRIITDEGISDSKWDTFEDLQKDHPELIC